MKTLLIIFHSMTDGARQMAEAAAFAARSQNDIVVRLMHASEAKAEDLLGADGYLFVTPENLAAISGVMKDFFDRNFYLVLDQLIGRPYATLICAGSDGHNAVKQIDRICLGWRLRKALESVIVCTKAQTPQAIMAKKNILEQDLVRCQEVGEALASGLTMGIF